MGFWGIEVKPGKPHPYHSDNVRGKLHLTQATLGAGSSKEKSILQCSIGHKSPVYLCSLLPDKNECCPLNLEFEDDDDVAAFSVIGPRSIHLAGFFEANEGDYIRDEYDTDSDGEDIDIAETESDESSEFGSEEDYPDFIIDDDDDDDLDMYAPSPIPNSGVVIEEIEEDEKPTEENQPKQAKKKNQSVDVDSAQKQIVVKGSGQVPVLESEDEDGFPISKAEAGEPVDKVDGEKGKDESDNGTGRKRKVKTTDQDGQLESEKKKKKKQKEKRKGGNADESNGGTNEQKEKENTREEKKIPNVNQDASTAKNNDTKESTVANDDLSEKKKKKKKKNKKQEAEGATNKTDSDSGNKSVVNSEENPNTSKSSHVRNYPNGLVVEELAMGKPDGKKASPGKQVSVRYIGKLQKNGKIFDSNIGRAPFKFRLGLGQVIKGWDVGVNGMRVGDKRRLTIPPAMGYGERGAGGKIPPNAWLVFDVELIDVR